MSRYYFRSWGQQSDWAVWDLLLPLPGLRVFARTSVVTLEGHSVCHQGLCSGMLRLDRPAVGDRWATLRRALPRLWGGSTCNPVSWAVSGPRAGGRHVQQQHHQHLAGPQGRRAAQNGGVHGPREGKPRPPPLCPHPAHTALRLQGPPAERPPELGS